MINPKEPIFFFVCNPHEALERQLIAENEAEIRERELELDLAREAELYPPTTEQHPEVIPAAIAAGMAEWDCYQDDRLWRLLR